MRRIVIDHIPAVWLEPDAAAGNPRGLAVWLPGFSGTKEATEPQLRALAAEGFIAISFDPWQHGKRMADSLDELRRRVAGNIRRHFWPILALTAEEFPRILDWAAAEFGNSLPVMAGGVSMGGDIAAAAAAVDRRIAAVAACIATADWLRPGSHEAPGTADAYARMHYDRRNPLTNLEGYRHLPAIGFQCGALDTQVPPDGAERFVDALGDLYRNDPGRLEVMKHPGVAHQFTPAMLEGAIRWFKLFSLPPDRSVSRLSP